MRVGLSNCIFGRRAPAERDFVDLHDAGVRDIEVCVLEGWLPPGDAALIAKVGAWARNNSLNIHSVHGPSGAPGQRYWLADPDKSRRAEAVAAHRMALEAANAFGAKYMVVEYECYGPRWFCWPKNIAPSDKYQTPQKYWMESVNSLLAGAERKGARLAIENIYGLPAMEQMEMMKDWDADLVGECFDSSHAVCGGHFFDEFALLAPKIIGTHLSDNDGFRTSNGDLHWPPFNGVIDWPQLISRLMKETCCEVLMLEVLDRETGKINADLTAAIDKIKRLSLEG